MRDSGQTSTAYDVPLLHLRQAHSTLVDTQLIEAKSAKKVQLNWVTASAKFSIATSPRTLSVSR